jgi:ABC transporter with metal-binding/Fe-S-binding domain ATP-binding protein
MLACLYSGGKDSTLAIHRVHGSGGSVELLITMVPKNDYSYMFHKPNVRYTSLQAEALGIRHIISETAGEKEKELVDLEQALKANGVDELVTGAVASMYQKDRIDRICRKLGIKHISPLWGMDQLSELREISEKFNAIVTSVSAEGLDESFLGARINSRLIEKLIKINSRYGINMSFEGGEAESFVLDAPLFRKSIGILRAHCVWSGASGVYVIDEAALEKK